MLKIKQFQLRVILDREDVSKLISDLSEKYDLLIHGMKKQYLRALKLQVKDEDEWIEEKLLHPEIHLLGGDVIYISPGTMMYYKIPFEKDLIEIGVVGDTETKEFKDFALRVKTSIFDALDDTSQDWEPAKQLNASFNLLADNAKTINPSQEDIKASIELQNDTSLNLMRIIKEKDSIFMDKLIEEAKIENVDAFVKVFSSLGLINSDFALLCNKTGQQILKIPNTTALDEISQKGFKCFICGASISNEKLVESISCSDFGRKILEDDYWFLVLALNALKLIGIPFDESLIYTGESPDTNIFLNLNNEAVMLQLTNRRLTLDDAYLINAHIAAYKLNYLILISTVPVSAVMKSHIMETNPQCSIHFIEGLGDLAPEINKIFINKEKLRLEEILKHMSEITPIPVDELIIKKILPNGKIHPKTGLEDALLTEFSDDSTAGLNLEDENESINNDVVATSLPGDMGGAPQIGDFFFEGESGEEETILQEMTGGERI